MTRILILVENLSVPFDRRVWQESCALTDAGYDVVVICPAGAVRDTEREIVLEGVRILRYPLRPATGGPAGYVREYGLALWHTLRLVLRVLREGPVHVVQACNPPDLLFLAALPLRARGAKFVFDHHDLVPELFRSRFPRGGAALFGVAVLLERLTFALADGVISTNESYRRVAIERGHMRPDAVQVVRSAPDLSRFRQRDPDPALRRGKAHLAAYVGVMGPQDGVDYALRALAHLVHDLGRRDLHTVFMGHGDAFDDMVALSRELGLDDCVEFTGRVSDEFLQRCLSSADVCLSPDPKNPLNDVSTMNKVVEYMAMGRPIVSFDLAEARVSAGAAAVYAAGDDERAFAALIDQLLDDPQRRAEMGALGRARVADQLSWATSRRNLVDFYGRLVGPAAVPRPGSRRRVEVSAAGTGSALGRKLAWYAARARAMSPAEVAWRAGTTLTGAVARRRRQPVLEPGHSWEQAYRSFRAAEGRPVLLASSRASELVAALTAETKAVVTAADAVLERRFGFFGQEPVAFPGDEIDWNLDPRTGHRWPRVPAAGIDHRTYPGDPKWIWELNRLQHLPWLAQAWMFTGEDRYADGALEQLDAWIRQNPPGTGIAWRGGLEAGVRAVSVAVAVQGLRDAPGMTLERYRAAVTMLAACAELAWRERSLFSSANNHLLGEMSGVATVAILFPELAGSAQAKARALRVLAAEAERQIHPDGSGAEQSIHYQIFAAEMLLVPAALLRLHRDPVPASILDALRRSAAFLRGLGQPLPRYGDEDGGFALRLHADPTPEVSRHLTAIDAVTDGLPVGSDDLAAAWLAGRDPARPPLGSGSAGRRGDHYAPDGGLVVLRRGGHRLTMDVGPLGYLSLAAHGHADALAVTLAGGDRPLIDDPGTGSYYAEPEWRDAFRGTRAHATVSVDDADQSVPGGAFLWVRHAATTVRTVDLRGGVVEAEHDGYTRFPEPVTHRRYLIAPPDQDVIAVVDLLLGSGSHRIRTSWPLHPELSVRTDGAAHVVDRDGVTVLRVTSAATAPCEQWAVRGDQRLRLGWWSGMFESRTPAWLVGAVIDAAVLPLAVVTVLSPAQDVTGLQVQLHDELLDAGWETGSGATSVHIDTGRPGAVRTSTVPSLAVPGS